MVRARFPNLRGDLRALFVVGWPLILNNLFSMGVNVADTLMIGRLGATPLAALAVGSGLWIGIFLGGLGILMALGPTVSHHFGAQRMMEIGHDTRQALWLAVGISALAILLMRNVSPLLELIGIAPEIRELAVGYLRALSWGVPGAYFYHAFRQMNEGVGRTVPIMVVTGLTLAINVSLSFVLVFGKFGLAPLGVQGCGLGSALSFWCMFLMILLHVRRHPYYERFDLWRGMAQPDRHAMVRLLGLGWPIGLSLLLQAGLFTTLALLMGRLGADYAAAHQITLNYAGLVFMIPLGLAFATAVLVGQATGRGAPREARRTGIVGIGLCFSIAGTIGIATLAAAPQIASLYTQDPAVVALATSLLAISAFLQLGDGTQSAAAGALRGLKDTRIPMLINGAIYWGVGFVAAWGLGLGLGWQGRGIWTGLALALCTAAAVLSLRFRYIVGRHITGQA